MIPVMPVEHLPVVREVVLGGLGSGLLAFGLLLAVVSLVFACFGGIAWAVSRLGR